MVTISGGGFQSIRRAVPLSDGSVCFAGTFEHPSTFTDSASTAFPLTSVGDVAAVLGCVDEDGRRLFTQRFGGSGDASFSDLVADADSNLYVTGTFAGTVDFGTMLVSRGSDDVVVASYRSDDGSHRWSRRYGSSGADSGSAMTTNGTDLFVGGTFTESIDFGGSMLSAPAWAGFVAQFDLDGSHVDSAAATVRSVAALRARPGGLVVGGSFQGSSDLWGIMRTATAGDGYVAILDGLAATALIQLEGPTDQYWSGVAVLDDLLVFAGNHQSGSILDGVSLPNRGNVDTVIAGFDGDVAWQATFGSAGFDSVGAVVESGTRHVIMAGRHSGASFGGSTLDPGEGSGVFVARYRVR